MAVAWAGAGSFQPLSTRQVGSALRSASAPPSVTFDCQCLCEHCYSDYEKDPGRKRFSVEEMKRAIDDALDLGAIVMNFAGGEPLVEPNLFEYLDHVKPHRGLTTMMTNAIKLTPEVARELARVRLYAMGVSVDSDQAEVHDRLRRILAHLFQHQIHHRGQVHAMLAGTAVKPPPLDEFFCTGEAHLRAAEFAALGFDETRIWGERATPPRGSRET